MDTNPLHIVISKDEVDRRDIEPALSTLTKLVADVETIRANKQNVAISFFGYENWPEEVYEIIEVRNFVAELDRKFPFWYYFSDLKYSSLFAIIQCFLPPFLDESVRAQVHAERLADWIEKQWGPALSHICQSAGETEADVDMIFSQVMDYLAMGPQQHWNN